VSQPWIAKGERSSWLTHIAATVNASLCTPTEKVTAFLELEPAIASRCKLDFGMTFYFDRERAC
jgi:hypothetical protein